jgi:hypothetical protein
MLLGAPVGALLLFRVAPVAPLVLARPCSHASPSPPDEAAHSSPDRRRVTLHAGSKWRAPAADTTSVGYGRAGESQRGTVRVRGRARVVPIENELA